MTVGNYIYMPSGLGLGLWVSDGEDSGNDLEDNPICAIVNLSSNMTLYWEAIENQWLKHKLCPV